MVSCPKIRAPQRDYRHFGICEEWRHRSPRQSSRQPAFQGFVAGSRLKLAEDRLTAANRTLPLFAAPSAAAGPIRTPAFRPLTSPGFCSPLSSPDCDPLIFLSVEEEEPGNKEASPARSTRSQTRGSSRVSKSKRVGKRSGKGINNGRRDCVRSWSENDRFD